MSSKVAGADYVKFQRGNIYIYIFTRISTWSAPVTLDNICNSVVEIIAGLQAEM